MGLKSLFSTGAGAVKRDAANAAAARQGRAANLTSFIGFSVTTQGVRVDGVGPTQTVVLLNAIDLVVGV